MKTNKKEFGWMRRFLEISSKAILKTHLEYAAWSVGQSGLVEDKKQYFSPDIEGIELADEPAVCSQIVIEALNSPLFAGDFDGKEVKYYRINREVKYISTRQKLDLYVQRYIPMTEDIDNAFEPVYIEAKRAVLHITKDPAKGNTEAYKVNDDAVRDDIDKLRKVKKKVFRCILVWGVFNTSLKSEFNFTPRQFLKKVNRGDMIDGTYIRWIPIGHTNNRFERAPEIQKWIWILLFEVKAP